MTSFHKLAPLTSSLRLLLVSPKWQSFAAEPGDRQYPTNAEGLAEQEAKSYGPRPHLYCSHFP